MRRKTKWVSTNFFLDEDDTKYYSANCPIDNNYAKKTDFCTGTYVNGYFSFYPPFVTWGCQCKSVLEFEGMLGDDGFTEGSKNYGPPTKFVSETKETVTIKQPVSPCVYLL